MYIINITRLKQGKTSTLGVLQVTDGNKEILFECKTLEELRESKERGQDCRIPSGEYKVKRHVGSRYQRTLSNLVGDICAPLLLYNDEIPADRYILIHPGNTARDTLGCILLGRDYGPDGDSIIKSRDACKEFYKLLLGKDDIIVIIENKLEEDDVTTD